jgi:hypothetical protein
LHRFKGKHSEERGRQKEKGHFKAFAYVDAVVKLK